MFDAGPCDSDGIAFLKRVLSDRVRGHLPANHDHRNRIHVGRGDAGDGIGDAGAGGDKANANLLRRTRIRVGCVDSGLLVPDQHMLEFVLFEYLVVDIKYRAARIAENEFDFFFGEATDKYFRARQLLLTSIRVLL